MNTQAQKEEATTSLKVAFTTFQASLNKLEKRIGVLERQRDDERRRFVDSAVSQGWKKFDFFSSYYGSHSELGEGDRNDLFLFHPSVDPSRWNGVLFSHGHHGQNEDNDRFDEWLSGLPEDHYVAL